jgi:hypothetical protein
MAKLEEALVAKAAKIVAKFDDDDKDADVYKAIETQLKVGRNTAIQLMYYAEPVADPSLQMKATGPVIKKARDGEGLRWERIAARAGISPAAARQLYVDAGGDIDASYTGKGKRPVGAPAEDNGKAKKAPAKKPAAAKKGAGAPKKARTRAELAARRP